MKQYTYEPGNATRYHLVYGRIEGLGGTPANDYLIAWLKEQGS